MLPLEESRTNLYRKGYYIVGIAKNKNTIAYYNGGREWVEFGGKKLTWNDIQYVYKKIQLHNFGRKQKRYNISDQEFMKYSQSRMEKLKLCKKYSISLSVLSSLHKKWKATYISEHKSPVTMFDLI